MTTVLVSCAMIVTSVLPVLTGYDCLIWFSAWPGAAHSGVRRLAGPALDRLRHPSRERPEAGCSSELGDARQRRLKMRGEECDQPDEVAEQIVQHRQAA